MRATLPPHFRTRSGHLQDHYAPKVRNRASSINSYAYTPSPFHAAAPGPSEGFVARR